MILAMNRNRIIGSLMERNQHTRLNRDFIYVIYGLLKDLFLIIYRCEPNHDIIAGY